MKIINTLEFSDQFMLDMISWCCSMDNLQIDPGLIFSARFRNSNTRAYRGRAWMQKNGGWFYLELGTERFFPCEFTKYGVTTAVKDRIEGIIHVTAHELAHVKQHRLYTDAKHTTAYGRLPNGFAERMEREAELRSTLALELFRRERQTLLDEWGYIEGDEDWNAMQKKILTAATGL